MSDHPGKNILMKTLVAAALIGLVSPCAAFAESADISTITCADLAEMPADSVAMLLTWIDGYMGGQASDTGFDVERLQANIDGAAEACTADPSASLMDVLHTAENG
jgi:acid stress chaperone HdeB